MSFMRLQCPYFPNWKTHRFRMNYLTDLYLNLPRLDTYDVSIDDRITIGCSADLTQMQQSDLRTLFSQAGPWRKGPFDLFGIPLDG